MKRQQDSGTKPRLRRLSAGILGPGLLARLILMDTGMVARRGVGNVRVNRPAGRMIAGRRGLGNASSPGGIGPEESVGRSSGSCLRPLIFWSPLLLCLRHPEVYPVSLSMWSGRTTEEEACHLHPAWTEDREEVEAPAKMKGTEQRRSRTGHRYDS